MYGYGLGDDLLTSPTESYTFAAGALTPDAGTPNMATVVTASSGLTAWLNTHAKTLALVGALGLGAVLLLKTMK